MLPFGKEIEKGNANLFVEMVIVFCGFEKALETNRNGLAVWCSETKIGAGQG